MTLRLTAILVIVSSITGCELVATFDRDKIPPPALMRPDASFPPVKPEEDLDSGPADAGRDAAVSDGAVTDGAVDGGPTDGAVDGGPLDATVDAN